MKEERRVEIALPCYPATLGGRRTHMRVGALVGAVAAASWRRGKTRADDRQAKRHYNMEISSDQSS